MAAPPPIAQERLACISRDSNPRITAHVQGHPSSVRAYFHGVGDTCGEYYVDMLPSAQDPTLYTALLPMVSSKATAVAYQVRVRNGGTKEIAGEEMTTPVDANCAAAKLTPDELRRAKSIALGLTQASQYAVPCQFKCNGIASVISAAGVLKPHEECRLLLAAAAKPWYATPAGIASASAAGALGGALALHSSGNGRNSNPPSPARP
jgi:hypothetical protein